MILLPLLPRCAGPSDHENAPQTSTEKRLCLSQYPFFFFLRLWSVEKDWPHIGMKMHSVGLVAISPETEMSLRLKRVVLAFPTLITFTQKALYVPQSPPLVYKAATSDLTVRAALFIQSAAQVDEGVDFLNRLTTLTCSCWLPALLQGVCFL